MIVILFLYLFSAMCVLGTENRASTRSSTWKVPFDNGTLWQHIARQACRKQIPYINIIICNIADIHKLMSPFQKASLKQEFYIYIQAKDWTDLKLNSSRSSNPDITNQAGGYIQLSLSNLVRKAGKLKQKQED